MVSGILRRMRADWRPRSICTYADRGFARKLIHSLPYQHDKTRHSWTDEEDRVLKEFVAENGTSWTKLAATLGMKGSSMKLRSRWKALQTVKENSWSNYEDADLVKAIHEYMKDGHVLGDDGSWIAVADKLKTKRTPSQCYSRWTTALLPRQGRAVAFTRFEKIRGWEWQADETQRLQCTMDAISSVQNSPEAIALAAQTEPWLLIDSGLTGYRLQNFWVYVASRVGTRTPAQCSRKWGSLAYGSVPCDMTTDDAKMLAVLVKKHGRKWVFLSQNYFPGRRAADLYYLYARWRYIEKKHNIDLLKIDPFARIRDYNGRSALRPTGKDGNYDPDGPLVRVYKSGGTTALTPYTLALINAKYRYKDPQARREVLPLKNVHRPTIPIDTMNKLLAAIARYKNDWVRISRSVGMQATLCRKYADILASKHEGIRRITYDAELEEVASRWFETHPDKYCHAKANNEDRVDKKQLGSKTTV